MPHVLGLQDDFLKLVGIHQQVNRFLGEIDTFKGSWKVLEQTKSSYLKELRKIATIDSTGSSTRIEGATLTDKEVEKLLKSVKISRLDKREEQEVVGYYEALEIISQLSESGCGAPSRFTV